jgi:SIR2-like domain/TIR domain
VQSTGQPLQVFISYRRSDAQSASRQLAEALKLRFGPDKVFLDTRDLAAGVEWRGDIMGRVQAAEVVLAVIGPNWAATAYDRSRRGLLDRADEDVVRLEIETAFTHGAVVIPVLVDDAQMPAKDALPRPFRPLAELQAHTLHHASWDRDVEALADTVARMAARPQPGEPPPQAPGVRAGGPVSAAAERMASYLAEGSAVTVLGSGANAVDRDAAWQPGAGSLPDSAEAARHLAQRFLVASESDDLARVSEHVSLTEGKVDLYRTLRELFLKAVGPPSSLHRFVAGVPRRLRELGLDRYQLVVTTNYDTALERAFDEAREPYDLAVFVAAGVHSGRFLHVPWWDPEVRGPIPITVPNEYVGLPIDEDGQLERTVIVKLHGGAADLGPGGPRLRDNFVVTEDDHIGYLTQSPVESLIPLQILNKLRDSHFLFLGYRMRDWSVRVFLRRVWGEQQVEARSWTVDPGLDVVERGLWDHFGVNVVDEPAADFLHEVECGLGRLARAHLDR